MSFFAELKRRNVVRVCTAYVVFAWLIIQVVETVLPAFGVGDAALRLVTILAVAGLVPAAVFAWAFELTPEGLKKESEVDRSRSITGQTARRLDRVIMVTLALALGYFAVDKFLIAPQRQAEVLEAAREEAIADARSQQRDRENNRSVAVLPFVNFSGDAGNDPFANGLHDDLLTQLSKIDALEVASRTSVMRYRETLLSIPEIGRELDVSAVLEGSLQRSEDRLRLNAQLIDARTDKHLWAETYDRELTAENVFALQSEIAKAIAASLHATLRPEEVSALEAVPTRDLAAYDAYTLGRGLLRSGKDQGAEALAAFEEATRIDPQFAAASAGACQAGLSVYAASRDPAAFDRAERHCTRAVTLDPSSAEVHLALGRLYHAYGDYALAEQSLQRVQFDKAERALRTALDLDALAVEARIGLGEVYASQGRIDEARAQLAQAAELRPEFPGVWSALFGFNYVYSDAPDRYAQAEAAAARAVELEPESPTYWNNLGSARYMREDFAGAGEAWKQSLQLAPNRTPYTNTGLAYYYAGDFAEAALMQRKAIELAPDDHRPVGRLGEALAMLPGQEAEARDAFKRAAELVRASLAINDQSWKDWGLLALYLARAEDAPGALHASARSLELSERHAEALFYVAQARLALGHDELALELLEETVAKDPAFRELAAGERAFQALADEPRFQVIMSDPQ